MKRSDLIKELALEMQNWMTAPSSDNDYLYEAGFVLNFLERKGMAPPGYMKPIPFESDGNQYPLVPGDFQNEKGTWCTPGQQEWEPEDEEVEE